jgi:hypothetical protein
MACAAAAVGCRAKNTPNTGTMKKLHQIIVVLLGTRVFLMDNQ